MFILGTEFLVKNIQFVHLIDGELYFFFKFSEQRCKLNIFAKISLGDGP